MTKKRRNELEWKIQSEFVSLIRYYTKQYPLLELLYSVPNEAKRSPLLANKLKASGMKSGVCDMAFPYPNGTYASLYLEFKTPTGVVSDNQKAYIKLLRVAKNRAEVVRSVKDALKIVEEHTGWSLPYFNITKGFPNATS